MEPYYQEDGDVDKAGSMSIMGRRLLGLKRCVYSVYCALYSAVVNACGLALVRRIFPPSWLSEIGLINRRYSGTDLDPQAGHSNLG